MVQKQRNTCKVCNKRSRTEYCFTHRPRKAINKTGKHFYKWKEARQEWYQLNKKEYYNCSYCGLLLHSGEEVLDHKKSRVRRPDLRYELDNLTIACHNCNRLKGSKDDTEFTKEMSNRGL